MREIDDARRAKRITMPQLAAEIGASKQYVHQLLRLSRPCPPATYHRLRELVGLALLLMLAACAPDHDCPETLADLCARWEVDGSILLTGSGQLEWVATQEPDDLGWELCL